MFTSKKILYTVLITGILTSGSIYAFAADTSKTMVDTVSTSIT